MLRERRDDQGESSIGYIAHPWLRTTASIVSLKFGLLFDCFWRRSYCNKNTGLVICELFGIGEVRFIDSCYVRKEN